MFFTLLDFGLRRDFLQLQLLPASFLLVQLLFKVLQTQVEVKGHFIDKISNQ